MTLHKFNTFAALYEKVCVANLRQRKAVFATARQSLAVSVQSLAVKRQALRAMWAGE